MKQFQQKKYYRKYVNYSVFRNTIRFHFPSDDRLDDRSNRIRLHWFRLVWDCSRKVCLLMSESFSWNFGVDLKKFLNIISLSERLIIWLGRDIKFWRILIGLSKHEFLGSKFWYRILKFILMEIWLKIEWRESKSVSTYAVRWFWLKFRVVKRFITNI